MPKQNVPALRLEGFSGEWEPVRLDAFDIKTGPFGSTLHAEDYVVVGTPIVTTEHFKSGQLPDTGDSIPQVSKQDTARLSMYLLDEGDIVFSRVGSVDINAQVTRHQKGWLFSGRVLRLRLDASCDAAFLHSALETEQVRTSIISRAVGQTMPSINTKILAATEVFIPPTLEEQQAIGAVFTNLDAAINQHTLKHKALQQSKTALMQRMFPQEGQTVPELRLEGFSGEWDETTLGELGSTYGGLSGKKKEDFGHGDAMYVTYKDIFSRALITDTSQCERVEVDASQNEVRYGDIFFTTSSEIPEEVGLSAVWLIDKPNVYLNSFCFGFRPTGGFDLHFLGHVLRSPAVRSQFLLLAQGISRFNISKTKAANISLYAPPTLEEQQAIGAVFTNLDQLIAAEAQYIASLKQAKTALLQRMFI